MVKHFKYQGYSTRTFLLCPTSTSNTLYKNVSTLQKSDTCEDERYFQLFLQNILAQVKKDWREFRRVQEVCEIVQSISKRGSVLIHIGNSRDRETRVCTTSTDGKTVSFTHCGRCTRNRLVHYLSKRLDVAYDHQASSHSYNTVFSDAELDRSTTCDSIERDSFHVVQDWGRETIGTDLQCLWKFGFLGRLLGDV